MKMIELKKDVSFCFDPCRGQFLGSILCIKGEKFCAFSCLAILPLKTLCKLTNNGLASTYLNLSHIKLHVHCFQRKDILPKVTNMIEQIKYLSVLVF